MNIKRDYKPKTTWKSRQRLRLHGLVVITLVVVGLLGSLLAYLRSDKPTEAVPALTTANPSEHGAASTKVSVSPPKPKYDFYQLLPERKLIIPENELKQVTNKSTQRSLPQQEAISKAASLAISPPTESATQATSPVTASEETVTHYIVQAGSFRNHTDADRRKASIAFLGISAHIETVRKDDGSTLHRVRIGPVSGANKVKALRQRLQDNNIQSISIKTN